MRGATAARGPFGCDQMAPITARKSALPPAPAIVLGYATDFAARHHRRLAPILEQYRGRPVLGRGLGHAREEAAKGDIMAAALGGGAVAARPAGHPDDAVRTREPSIFEGAPAKNLSETFGNLAGQHACRQPSL